MSTPNPLLDAVRGAVVSFPTLDEIKVALGIEPTDTSQDAAIVSTMTANVAIIESYLGRGIASAPESQQFEPIDTRDGKLFLSRFPVQSVTEVRADGSPVTGWRVFNRQGIVDLGRGCCNIGPRHCCGSEPVIVVEYVGGYPDDAWPADLADAVMRAFYLRWNETQGNSANVQAGTVKQWTADGLSVSLAEDKSGMGSSSSTDVIPPELVSVAAILDPYRVRFVRGV